MNEYRREGAADQSVEMEVLENLSREPIVGVCPDMCPEVERSERERKGGLDRFERVGGNRNRTSRQLAVKKYTRTAEKDPVLIRPLSVLKKTMDHLLALLERSHHDDLLAVHSFLWDRMRAVRMDLRMQRIFTDDAIIMHEKMIRFHILSMHELCEYSQGEGISEVFDPHLNIEQMNKASVDLFQMYEDRAKRGTPVPTEAEFRGYYALLKLDKHPGYRVEPAELSLDLAKMAPEIRSSRQLLFARDVARACRAGNYVAFFRLARQASYLQACLMHAHFSKLRTQALASLHSGLQKNQGIPLSTVINWLGMEGEDVEALISYHGFSTKYYEEPYLVKEGPFLNKTQDFPTCRAQLVDGKQSLTVALDVQEVQGGRQLDTVSQTWSPMKRTRGKGSIGMTVSEVTHDLIEPADRTALGSVLTTEEAIVLDHAQGPLPGAVESNHETTDSMVLDPAKGGRDEEEKTGKKRHMDELQFEAEEHERRRLRHEADAAARRAASQAAIEAAAMELKRQEEQLRIAGHQAEALAGKQGFWFRRWRRRVASIALEKHQKLQQAELHALSLGYLFSNMRVSGESLNFTQELRANSQVPDLESPTSRPHDSNSQKLDNSMVKCRSTPQGPAVLLPKFKPQQYDTDGMNRRDTMHLQDGSLSLIHCRDDQIGPGRGQLAITHSEMELEKMVADLKHLRDERGLEKIGHKFASKVVSADHCNNKKSRTGDCTMQVPVALGKPKKLLRQEVLLLSPFETLMDEMLAEFGKGVSSSSTEVAVDNFMPQRVLIWT